MERGARATAYKRCFDVGSDYDNLRPIFWWNNDDKVDYENTLNVIHSDCYSVYGLPRTGCVGCPFARDLEGELEVIEKYEPRLYRAVTNVFSDSYEYRKNTKNL